MVVVSPRSCIDWVRGAPTREFVVLLSVERSPLRAVIDGVLGENEAAFLTDPFAAVRIVDDRIGLTVWTETSLDRLRLRFGAGVIDYRPRHQYPTETVQSL